MAASPLVRAYLAIAAFAVFLNTVNVLTVLHDVARYGEALAPWKPITWESSSGIATLAACGVIYAALRLAPPVRGGWGRALAIHAGASLIYSALHIGGMVALRTAVYAAVGLRYRMALADIPYEYRKDLVSYVIMVGIFWLVARPAAKPPAAPPPDAPSASTFDIVAGALTLRAPVREILSLRAAGNYVEFQLEDGRRPLMRASLRDMEAALGSFGFVRTHRSWIVNGRRVRSLRAAGSGDFHIELDCGMEAPLSRRFPAALARLRASDAVAPG